MIDTPGIYDTARSEKEVAHEILRCLCLCAPGPHVLLFVVKALERFTKEEMDVYETLKIMFGDKIRNYIIVIITQGDKLSKNGKTIEDVWADAENDIDLANQAPLLMRTVIKDVAERYIVFNNKGDTATKDKQVLRLLKMVTDIATSNSSKYFSDDNTRAVWKAMDIKMKSIMLEKWTTRKETLALIESELVKRKPSNETIMVVEGFKRKQQMQRELKEDPSKKAELERRAIEEEKKIRTQAYRVLLKELQHKNTPSQIELLRIMMKKPEINTKQACKELQSQLHVKMEAWENTNGELLRIMMEKTLDRKQAWNELLHRLQHDEKDLAVKGLKLQCMQEEIEIIRKEAWAKLQQDQKFRSAFVTIAVTGISAGIGGVGAAAFGTALTPAVAAAAVCGTGGAVARKLNDGTCSIM